MGEAIHFKFGVHIDIGHLPIASLLNGIFDAAIHQLTRFQFSTVLT